MTFKDLPEDIRKDMLITAREIHGSGYTIDFYRQIAVNWIWLYQRGLDDGKMSARSEDRERIRQACDAASRKLEL